MWSYLVHKVNRTNGFWVNGHVTDIIFCITLYPNPQGVVHIQRDRKRGERGSKESISSSWSSLFNVPGTSSGTVSIRPNSVAVSNLSSSGSATDYAAKVAFIGKKYRKETKES